MTAAAGPASGNFLCDKVVHCCASLVEQRERTHMMALRAPGEVALKSLCPIAAVLTLFASGWAASAETSEERQACIGDAFRVCWAAIPDRNNVLQCLIDNRSQLNPSCREVINRYVRSQRHRPTRSAQSGRSRAE